MRLYVTSWQFNTLADMLVSGDRWVAIHVFAMACFDTIRSAYTFMETRSQKVFGFCELSVVPMLLLAAASTYCEAKKWPTYRWLSPCAWLHEKRPGALHRPTILDGRLKD